MEEELDLCARRSDRTNKHEPFYLENLYYNKSKSLEFVPARTKDNFSVLDLERALIYEQKYGDGSGTDFLKVLKGGFLWRIKTFFKNILRIVNC
ncbi:hypothetical protein MHBO_001157 [Bonamia ostreae]|uniref:Uncharacterized protein n=1 Tax=Bonamia ostreae TaxID=126728 RepID=A0ABV2AI67_9EUKA